MVHPLPDSKSLSAYYEQNYYSKPSLLFRLIQKNRVRNFASLKKGKLLDVGCGTGAFLKAMQQQGWRCFGTEFSASSRSFEKELKEKKIQVFFGNLTDQPFSENMFDLVTLWHVAEHLVHPQKEFAFTHKILKKNGILFLAIPNIDSMSFRLWKCNWFHLDLPRHLTHFSPATVSALLQQNGFRVFRISHSAIEYNPYGVLQSIYNRLGFEFNFLARRIKGQPHSNTPVFWFQLLATFLLLPLLLPLSIVLSCFFSLAGKGDTLQVWAKKA